MRIRMNGSKLGTFLATTAVAVTFAWAPNAQGVIIRDGLDGYDGTQDASVLILNDVDGAENPTNNRNYGGSPSAFTRNSSSSRTRLLLSFDLSHLAGQDVQSATLTLTKNAVANTADTEAKSILAYEISTDNGGWVQGSGDGTVAENGWVTGNMKAHNVTDWIGGAKIGDVGTLADGVVDATGTTSYHVSDPIGTQYELILPVALVQSWIDNPSANAGLLLSNTGGSAQVIYASSDYTANETWRPTLDITLVPEPGTAGVLAVAGLALAARRRR